MPGLTSSKLNFYEIYKDRDDLFGFFYCIIETPLDIYLGLLPVRTSKRLTFLWLNEKYGILVKN